MPTQKAGIFTLAQFAKTPEEKEWFYKKFKLGVINDKDEYGSGLLHYAIAGRNFDIALFLIEKGIDLNMVDSDGNTALHTLVQVRANNESHDTDKYGNTALWHACHFANHVTKDYRMVKLLLKYHSDVNSKNNRNDSPLDLARERGLKDLQEILENANVK